MERAIEQLLLSMRWLLLPLFVALLLSLVLIYLMVGRELWHAAETITTMSDTDLVIALCSVLDLVLIANLLVMVAVSSYESYISRIEADAGGQPEWLGKLDSGNVKVKVAVSVAMISGIHLLRGFVTDQDDRHLLVMAAVHAVFVLATLGLALVDRTSRHG